VVVLDGDRLAVIERTRAGAHYFVLPGGGVEDGESVEDAAVREAFEELGVHVSLVGLVAVVDATGEGSTSRQHHFAATITGGRFGAGTGPELQGHDPSRGSYRPTWIDLGSTDRLDVRPRPLLDALARRGVASLLQEPLHVVEHLDATGRA
jgi:ADP-ribose pyrophosphatase YjhB (NUDIX family)